MGPGFGGPPPLFIMMASIVGVVIVSVFGMILYRVLSTWTRNNASPVLTREAKVIGKRSQVRGGGGDSSVRTSYFITFELENGERVELPASGSQFGILVESDRGMLTWQGTRFKGFDRAR